MKKLFLSLYLLLAISSKGQNLDSLFNEFLRYKGKNVVASQITSSANQSKCGFGLAASIMMNYEKFTAKQKLVLSTLLKRPECDTSIISPQKRFKIYFFKNGNNSPTFDVNEFSKAADSSYNYEVKGLGFPAPSNDIDGYYPVYLDYLGSGYGNTWPEKNLTPNTWSTYIVINSNFDGVYTHGIDAARVTIAHELHHAIQMGNYIFREDDRFYHELTSTSMEGYVFNSIKDYYQYLNSYFQNPGNSINAYGGNTGYNLAIWHFYLTSKFGMNIIKEIWEKMPSKRAVECFDDALKNHGSSLLKEFNQFGIWTYYTNIRTIPGQFFKDADKYPLIRVGMQTQFTYPSTTITVTSKPISNNFVEVDDGANKIILLVTNADIQSILTNQSTIPFDVSLSKTQSPGFGAIDNGYYSKLSSTNPSVLADSYMFNGKVVSKIESMEYSYPQPFYYSKHSVLFFPAELTADGTVDLNIYSVEMNLVYSAQSAIMSGDKVVIAWNVLDSNGRKLSTGVYIYVVKCGDKILKGKFVVFND
jgi:hypothetical protein